MLEGFERIGSYRGTPKVTITNNGLSFNEKAKSIMRDSFIVFLINRDSKRIATQKVIKTDSGAIDTKRIQRVFTNRGIREAIIEMMGWNLEKHYYTARGTYDKRNEAIIFDLNMATEKEKIKRRRNK